MSARWGAIALCVSLALVSPAAAGEVVRLATTTSTENSGLLKALIPPFEAASGLRVHVIPVGTGKALRLGEQGDVDVVLVHARVLEYAFVEAGFGVNRRDVMYNDFVLVGPLNDPASARTAGGPIAALRKIAASSAPFVSRGDNSGTHVKELALWKRAELEPSGPWYRESGQGMGRVLQMASELDAYTLADRGTWIYMRAKLDNLAVLAEGGSFLRNSYGIIAVNPARFADANYLGAMSLIAWVTSVEGQRIVADYRVDGEVLFHPMAVTP